MVFFTDKNVEFAGRIRGEGMDKRNTLADFARLDVVKWQFYRFCRG